MSCLKRIDQQSKLDIEQRKAMRRDEIRSIGNINAAPRITATNKINTVPVINVAGNESASYNPAAMLGECSHVAPSQIRAMWPQPSMADIPIQCLQVQEHVVCKGVGRPKTISTINDISMHEWIDFPL